MMLGNFVSVQVPAVQINVKWTAQLMGDGDIPDNKTKREFSYYSVLSNLT